MTELERGDNFAGCRIVDVLGRGGMGVVYRAIDLELGRDVALKLIDSRETDDALRRRFTREARLAAAIEHPNVVPVYGAGEEAGRLYLLMRYVPGTDLSALLRREGRLAPARAVTIVAQIASALDAAHAAGLVHRDVKPANVLITGDDHVYLADFGITHVEGDTTRVTDSGGWVGTVDFMSPEHLRGDPVDGRSDVYSLACVLYTTLTGVPPLHRETVAATMQAQLNETAPPPSSAGAVPATLDHVLARALAKDPAARYATAGALARAASAAAAGAAPADEEQGESDRFEPPTRVVAPGAIGDAGATRVAAGGPSADAGATRVAAGGPSADAGATRVARPAQQRTAAQRPAAVPVRSGRRRRLALVAAIMVLLLPAAIYAWSVLRPQANKSGPLSELEVRAAAQGFAAAYSSGSTAALSRLLTPDARRAAPDAIQYGRPAILTEYARQFATTKNRRYVLSGLQTRAGDVGRAQGRYTVTRAGAPPLGGTITFLVVRYAGAPRIALLATEPGR